MLHCKDSSLFYCLTRESFLVCFYLGGGGGWGGGVVIIFIDLFKDLDLHNNCSYHSLNQITILFVTPFVFAFFVTKPENAGGVL